GAENAYVVKGALQKDMDELAKLQVVLDAKVNKLNRPEPSNFTDNSVIKWSTDEFGPLWVPKEGETIQLTPENVAKYGFTISKYEGHDEVKIKEGKLYIDNNLVETYTFVQNYYFMMGDNRHNSADSRKWGFVPEDHIVGKPLFIWFSTKYGDIKNGIRWDRIFTGAKKP
ncbi:MAG: signal peptidase I, partial [Saprospiraceae bacterium]|nr:signal peptidase I [Saprospiraceae bacterium]